MQVTQSLGGEKEHKTVMITGASGYVGDYVTKFLAHSEFGVVATYRSRFPALLDHVFPVCTDFSSVDLLAPALRGVSSIIHLAWDHSFVGSPALSQSANLMGLQNLLKAAEKAKVSRFIFLSVRGASAQTTHPFLFEKYCAEALVLQSQIPCKRIVRSSLIMGGNMGQNRFLSHVQQLVKKIPGLYPVPVWQEALYPLHLSDVALVLRHLLLEETLGVSLLSMKGQTPYRLEDVFQLVSRQGGSGYRIPVKKWLGEYLLTAMEAHGRRGGQAQVRMKDFLRAEQASAGEEGIEIRESFFPSERKSLEDCFP